MYIHTYNITITIYLFIYLFFFFWGGVFISDLVHKSIIQFNYHLHLVVINTIKTLFFITVIAKCV